MALKDVVVRTKDLAKHYGEGEAQVRALNGVSCEIYSGEYLSIMGPSGSGKSTLLHILGAMDTPSSGEVLWDGQPTHLLGARGWYRGVRLPLLGQHQAQNAAIALRVLELCGVTEEAIRAGFAAVSWPGRMELLAAAQGTLLLLDAAHNPAKCRALAEAIRQYFPGRPVHLVLGALADKNVAEMARPLLELAAQTWVTTPESPRQLPAERLAETCAHLGFPGARVVPGVPAAVDAALTASGPSHLVVITGSFYTVGPARRHLLVPSAKKVVSRGQE